MTVYRNTLPAFGTMTLNGRKIHDMRRAEIEPLCDKLGIQREPGEAVPDMQRRLAEWVHSRTVETEVGGRPVAQMRRREVLDHLQARGIEYDPTSGVEGLRDVLVSALEASP